MSNHSVLCLGWLAHYIFGPGSFLFSLRSNNDLGPFKAPLKNEYDWQSIFRYNSYGPCFGAGHSLCIWDNARSTNNSYTNLGFTYQAPPGYTYRKPNTRSLLAGSYHFTPSEVEVFYLK